MNRLTRKWTAGALLALALCGWTVKVGFGADDEDEELKKATAAAKKVVEAKLGVPVDAAMLAKDHKMDATMRLFKMGGKKGGIGIGNLTKAGHQDSIDHLILDYATKAPTKAELTKYADDLIKVGQAATLIAELTPYWGPGKAVSKERTPEKWKTLTRDMKEGANDLIAAAKAKDEKAVSTAAAKLKISCAECHRIFRTDK